MEQNLSTGDRSFREQQAEIGSKVASRRLQQSWILSFHKLVANRFTDEKKCEVSPYSHRDKEFWISTQYTPARALKYSLSTAPAPVVQVMTHIHSIGSYVSCNGDSVYLVRRNRNFWTLEFGIKKYIS